MSADVNTLSAVKPPVSVPPLVAWLSGRITAKSRRITTQQGVRFLTVVALPAPDEFTSPGMVELRSEEALGDFGDTVRCKVQIGGYRRNYNNKETGAVVQSATNSLDVLL